MVADAQAATAGAQQVGVQFAALDFAVDEGAAHAQLGRDLVGCVEGHGRALPGITNESMFIAVYILRYAPDSPAGGKV